MCVSLANASYRKQGWEQEDLDGLGCCVEESRLPLHHPVLRRDSYQCGCTQNNLYFYFFFFYSKIAEMAVKGLPSSWLQLVKAAYVCVCFCADRCVHCHGADGNMCREAEEENPGPHPRADPWKDDSGSKWKKLAHRYKIVVFKVLLFTTSCSR